MRTKKSEDMVCMTLSESGLSTGLGRSEKGMGRSTVTLTDASAVRQVASGRSVTLTSNSKRSSSPSCCTCDEPRSDALSQVNSRLPASSTLHA